MTYLLARAAVACTDADRGLVVYPCGDGTWAARYLDLTPEQAAEILYQMADGIVDQKTAPMDLLRRFKGGRNES